MISVPVLLLCAALTSRVVSARDASAQDIVTFEVDGETQRVLGAHVFSTNNENTRFQAVIYAAGARLAPGEANAQLRLGAERVAFTGSSAMPFEWTRYLAVLGAEQAQRVADGLELELQRRRDLGHALEGTLTRSAPISLTDDAVTVRFRLANTGGVPLAFLKGGRNRNATGRDNRFRMRVTLDGEPLPDPGPTTDRGGLAVYRSLEQGAHEDWELDLRQWCDFPRAGTYRFEWGYDLELRYATAPAGTQKTEPWAHQLWDDQVTGEVTVEVAGVDAPVLRVAGAATPFEEIYVVSQDNANQDYAVTLRFGSDPEHVSPYAVLLEVGPHTLAANSTGFDGKQATAGFTVEPGRAAGIAAALGVALQRREHFGHRIASRFDPGSLSTSKAPESLPATFVLENVGTVAIEILDGGRSRNAAGRDNRFTFTIKRDGQPIEPIQIHDFGGSAGIKQLGPAEEHSLTIDLVHWCTFEQPGTYELQASLEFSVSPPGHWQEPGNWLTRAHRQWDEIRWGTLRVVVD